MANQLPDHILEPGKRSFWRGTAEGGPLDGSEISVEATPGLPMRALHVVTSVGNKDDGTEKWHLYAFGQRADERGVHGFFKHFTDFDGYPPAAVVKEAETRDAGSSEEE
jgi:hypothetical protein